jgi:hypothetical protein
VTVLREVRHRTRGRAETHLGGGMRLDEMTTADLLALPEARALRLSVDAATDPDFRGRGEHIELVVALTLRVRMAAAAREARA